MIQMARLKHTFLKKLHLYTRPILQLFNDCCQQGTLFLGPER